MNSFLSIYNISKLTPWLFLLHHSNFDLSEFLHFFFKVLTMVVCFASNVRF